MSITVLGNEIDIYILVREHTPQPDGEIVVADLYTKNKVSTGQQIRIWKPKNKSAHAGILAPEA
ncbi:MAG: hypothetical protein KA515_01690 [Candidatus Pacebacteria bacterium]|nr:hypothetical protein [Candidatus Paceibacterota bacterium]